jgi:hypothetical protein
LQDQGTIESLTKGQWLFELAAGTMSVQQIIHMKMISKLSLIGFLLLLASPGNAQPPTGLSYDLFGAYATRDKDGNGDNTWGLGLGVNYFLTENMGVGVDTYTDGIRVPYMLNASFIYRFATWRSIDPYAFAGFGRQWEHASQWTGHFGGGAEYNLKLGPSIFLDGRLVLPGDTGTYGLIRFGVRLRF